MNTEQLVHLDPSQILIDNNIRYGIKPERVDALADLIVSSGGVNTPIEVEELAEPIDGKTYRLTAGEYRVTAVSKLNREQNAGLTIPARVVPVESSITRKMRQISENNDRENLSPMDKANGISELIALGASTMDIRKAFSAPGGRKGMKIQPASNSHINILKSFLDFPKDIQKKIHSGVIGMGAAYKLTKLPKDKWAATLEAVEAERLKAIDVEEKDEETFLAQSQKSEAVATAAAEVAKALEETKAAAAAAEQLVKERAEATTAALQAQLAAKGDAKKQATEHFKAAKQELDAAQGIADKAQKELEKASGKAQTLSEKAQAAKDRLEAARSAKTAKATNTKAKAAPVTGKDVDKAAKKVGATTKAAKLNADDMREAVKSLIHKSRPQAAYPRTVALGTLIDQCFEGKITEAQLVGAVQKLMGEAK